MSGLYEVSWPEYTGNRTACLSDLLKRKVFVDVTLVGDDNAQISAHKVILSSSSAFFQNILENNPHPNPMIYIKGLNKKLFSSLLDFIYLGEVSLPEADFETFIKMARDLKIKGLLNEAPENDNKKKTPSQSRKHNITEKQMTTKTTTSVKSKLESEISNPVDDPDDPPYEAFESRLDEMKSSEENTAILQQEEITKKEVKKEPARDTLTVPDDFSFSVAGEIYAKVNALLITTPEGFWVCTECRYGSKSKDNVMEHAEMHIKGIVHNCKYCNKTFQKKMALRNHVNKCYTKTKTAKKQHLLQQYLSKENDPQV